MTESIAIPARQSREADLARRTRQWAAPWLVELHPDDMIGRGDLAVESSILRDHGYVVAYDMVDEGQLVVTYAPTETAAGLADLDYAAAALHGSPSTLIRVYSGKRQADANLAWAAEAEELATYGYVPISQTWVPGNRGLAQVALAFILAPVLILVPILLNRSRADREGAIAVTYELRHGGRPASRSDGIDVAAELAAPRPGPVLDELPSRTAAWWRERPGWERLAIFGGLAGLIVAMALIVPYALIAAGVWR